MSKSQVVKEGTERFSRKRWKYEQWHCGPRPGDQKGLTEAEADAERGGRMLEGGCSEQCRGLTVKAQGRRCGRQPPSGPPEIPASWYAELTWYNEENMQKPKTVTSTSR